jgi:hypothetical protein
MKKLILLILLCSTYGLFAQVALKLSNIRPTGDMGASLKPTLGVEVMYKDVDDEPENGFKVRFSAGFAKFKSRKDTFPTYGVIVSQGTTVTPGYMVIHKYNLTNLSMGVDYMIGLGDKLFLYPGTDVGALFSSVEYESYTELISDEGYSGGYVFISFRMRAGAEYRLTEKLALYGEATRSMNFSPEVGGLGYNDYGVGLRIKF